MFEPHEEDDPYRQAPLPYQPYSRGYPDPARSQQQGVRAPATRNAARTRPGQDASSRQRMSKAEALHMVARCKRWLVAGSLVGFAALSGLAAAHAVGTNSSAVGPAPAASTPSASPVAPSAPVSPTQGGGFFQQGGSNFGSGSTSQPPVSGSGVS